MGTLREGRIPMSFDEMYDEMLHGEFSSRGQHQANAVEPVQSYSRGRHAATERPRGFQRYRTAGLVGAGGLACAAAGALLGGLGGYFSISPAAAHQVGAATITQDLPLAQAVTNAAHSTTSGAKGTSALEAASFSKVSGSLTQGIAPFATLTSLPLQNLPVTGIPGLYSGSGGTGIGTGVVPSGTVGGTNTPSGAPAGCTSGSNALGLTCMLASLPGALSSLGSVGDPGGLLNSLPQLGGLVTDLQGLTQLLPIASLPLPTGGVVPTTLLAGPSNGSAPSSPVNVGGILGGTSSNPVSALAPVLNTVGTVASGLGTTTPSLPVPLPTPGSTTPGLPVGLPSLPLPLPSVPSVPVVSTPSNGSSSGSTTINVPVPVPVPLPLPATQPISIGGLSVGISTSGSNSGLTLTLP